MCYYNNELEHLLGYKLIKFFQVQGIRAENDILKKEKLEYDSKYSKLHEDLKIEFEKKLEERQLFAKHLSEKTKLYEVTKSKLENVEGDFEATKHKHATVVKVIPYKIRNLFYKTL